jgi:hypothetical protein
LNYKLTNDEIKQFREQGYLVLNDFLAESEVATLDDWFDHFVAGKQEGMGRDFCDMSQPYDTPVEQFRLVNAVLPSHYCDELKNNIFHQVASNVANQLYSAGGAVMDYDQFLAKKPGKEQAQFLMHQDLGYWPKTKNTWTATFSLALTDSDIENGCLVVIPGTNNESDLRVHRPVDYSRSDDLAKNRDESHTLMIESRDSDNPIYLPVKRGSITIHDERIIHGSGGNTSDIWRKTYVMAFRPEETVKEERAMGFTHSHNDDVNWETFIR